MEEEIKEPEQEVFEKQTLTDYLESKKLETFTADLKPDAVRYFIANNEIVLNGQPVPAGGACVSLFGNPFIYMTTEDFEKWIVPNSAKPMPISTPVVEEPELGKVIASSKEFEQYVSDNKIFTIKAVPVETPIDAFEAREDLTVVTCSDTKLETRGGDFVCRNPETGAVFSWSADKFHKQYKQIPKETN